MYNKPLYHYILYLELVDYIDMRDYQNRKVYLFVINFHHVKYGSAAFIRNEIYSSFAKNYPYDFDLFLIGPKKDIENKIYGMATM